MRKLVTQIIFVEANIIKIDLEFFASYRRGVKCLDELQEQLWQELAW